LISFYCGIESFVVSLMDGLRIQESLYHLVPYLWS
jgi:hypothetical protein